MGCFDRNIGMNSVKFGETGSVVIPSQVPISYRERCRDLTADIPSPTRERMKRKSRPQILVFSGATKVVVGMHNPKVVGSSPASATKKKDQLATAGLFLAPNTCTFCFIVCFLYLGKNVNRQLWQIIY